MPELQISEIYKSVSELYYAVSSDGLECHVGVKLDNNIYENDPNYDADFNSIGLFINGFNGAEQGILDNVIIVER